MADNDLQGSGPRLRILILGAGLAGLVAGYELRRAGHKVTILEATLRPGGRVRTLREPFADHLYAEAGAGRIPITHTLTRDYAARFGLTLTPYRPSEGATVIYGGGRRLVARSGEPVDLAKLGLAFTTEELRLGIDGMYQKYVGRFSKLIGTIPAEQWPSAEVRRFGDMSMKELMQGEGASAAAIRYLTTGYEEDSALDFLRDAYSHEASRLDHIVGGNDLLPRGFADSLADEILYGSPVVRVEQDDQSVRAIFVRGGRRETLIGDRLICTLPFSVLRQVEFSPRLSPKKQRAVQDLPYGSVTRVYLQYRDRFWAKEGCNGFADMFDLPMEVWHPTHDQPGRRAIQLGYMYESLARKVTAMAEPERIRFFLQLVGNVFPGAVEHVEGGTSFSWAEQPYQRGAFAVYNKGVYTRLGADVARPEGRIHFAGEHTSPWPGWMQGALYSGLRAAREVTGKSQ